MVDEPRLVDLLRRINEDVLRLRDLDKGDRHSLVRDEVRLAAVKYNFLTAIEGSIRAAQHMAASEGWRRPGTNADAFRVLATHGVLDDDLAGRLARAAGFRNLLIHEYVTIDDHRVVENLASLDDLGAFTVAVSRWLASSSQGP